MFFLQYGAYVSELIQIFLRYFLDINKNITPSLLSARELFSVA
jgi:hypothetical protein